MIRKTRLGGMGTSRPENRLKPVKYTLTATMVSPDQVEVDLLKNGKFAETLVTVEPAMDESNVDHMGRLKPESVWNAINMASQHLMERDIEHVKPNKSDVYQGDYSSVSAHPRVKD